MFWLLCITSLAPGCYTPSGPYQKLLSSLLGGGTYEEAYRDLREDLGLVGRPEGEIEEEIGKSLKMVDGGNLFPSQLVMKRNSVVIRRLVRETSIANAKTSIADAKIVLERSKEYCGKFEQLIRRFQIDWDTINAVNAALGKDLMALESAADGKESLMHKLETLVRKHDMMFEVAQQVKGNFDDYIKKLQRSGRRSPILGEIEGGNAVRAQFEELLLKLKAQSTAVNSAWNSEWNRAARGLYIDIPIFRVID